MKSGQTKHDRRPISALTKVDISSAEINQDKRRKQEYCQSENYDNSQKTQNQKKIPLLLVKLKLQQLGFRAQQYNQYIQGIQQIELKDVSSIALEIINSILNQPQSQIISILNSQRLNQSRHLEPLIIQNQNANKINCPVCLLDYEKSQLIHLNCNHFYCKSCLTGHIQNSVYEAKYEISCMEFNCKIILDDDFIKLLSEEQLYNRYTYFKKKKLLEGNPNNKFCSVPNCQGVLEEVNDSYLCPQCKAQYCFQCIRPKHQGDCSEKIEQIIDQSYKNYNIKKCPNCRAPIQKQDGCNHMNCKNCNYEFCWLCLGKYTKYHFRYFNCCGCPGMQFQNQQERGYERFVQVCVFMILPGFIVLTLLAVAALLPMYMFGMIFIKSVQKAMQFDCLAHCCQCNCCQQSCDQDDCCLSCCAQNQMNLAHFGVAILLLPYGVLYALTLAPVKFFIHVYEFIIELLE